MTVPGTDDRILIEKGQVAGQGDESIHTILFVPVGNTA